GLGEVPNMEVAAFMSRYRYFFSPIRYASLGLSLVEAMLCGVPVVGFGGTELPVLIRNGENGYVDNRLDRLVEVGRQLLAEPELARAWGSAGRDMARQRFGMDRFVSDWLGVFETLMEAA
ncbi:glycosyltransferase, partial [Achromobacter mucicolens]